MAFACHLGAVLLFAVTLAPQVAAATDECARAKGMQVYSNVFVHEIVQTHFVKITGGLNSTTFRGKVSIEGLAKNDPMRLKRVKQIWFCKK